MRKMRSSRGRKRKTRIVQGAIAAAVIAAAAGYGIWQYQSSPAAGAIEKNVSAAEQSGGLNAGNSGSESDLFGAAGTADGDQKDSGIGSAGEKTPNDSSMAGSGQSGQDVPGNAGSAGGAEASAEVSGMPDFSGDTVFFEGKTYQKNSYVKAILCLGVDRSGPMAEEMTTGFGGQADGIFLVAQDTARNRLQVLLIPRDTMTPITLTDLSGNIVGKEIQHLTLAYAYGDGREKSCEYMAEAVSDLFHGFPIDHYLAADTEVINLLNDGVGGVTVTIPTEGMEVRDPAFVKGATVTLHGTQAESFLRWRDLNRQNSALYRMDQHQEYMTQFMKAVREKSKENSRIVTDLADLVSEYLVTDLGKDEYIKIGMDALQSQEELVFYTVPGQGVSTAAYDEFYADEGEAARVLLKMFYREKSE